MYTGCQLIFTWNGCLVNNEMPKAFSLVIDMFMCLQDHKCLLNMVNFAEVDVIWYPSLISQQWEMRSISKKPSNLRCGWKLFPVCRSLAKFHKILMNPLHHICRYLWSKTQYALSMTYRYSKRLIISY